jgi:ribosomal protein S18 acetylase RimI-like enzyme
MGGLTMAAPHDPKTGATLVPLTPDGFATLERIARQIWNAHYTKIISQAQIDYMLAGRFTTENLSRYVDSTERWSHLLQLGDETVGYCGYSITETPGELKLEQLYVLASHHGRGLGGFMLRFVEARARELGRPLLMLTVNKQNTGSIAVYRHAGFTVREEKVFDIGNRYVMDDYVMEKRLG